MASADLTIKIGVGGEDEARAAIERVSRSLARTAGVPSLVWAFAVAFLGAFLGGVCAARAEDALDIRGTKHGCQDVTASGGWDTLTSASLENQQGAAALSASLYWTEVVVKGGSAAVYVCEAAAASCGSGTANKMAVATGATLVLPLRGLSVQSIAVYAAIGTTVQVCGYFRTGG